ncbi:MAG: N,N'-diacetylchitobiose phosphorylase [Clostridiales bacterium]|nr:N,N'-diacetylchitobiose phosphorylase [Clostridiales bacterium]
MQYGHFDDAKREYVIDRVDTPASWTNYIGVNDMCAVLNQTAGGYAFYKSPEYHRITRFRPNGVPLDRPGHYMYLRDDETGDFWSVSWQPVAKPLEHYTCRHGLSYSRYQCNYGGLTAEQTVFIPLNDPVELWDVRIKNDSDRTRRISAYSYVEWSYHHIEFDNQNFQMSNYCSGSSYEDGMILYDLFYEEFGYQFFTASFRPDGFDALRDSFIGVYHDESNPVGVMNGRLSGSFEKTGNHCAALQKCLTLAPGEEVRLIFMMGQGRADKGAEARAKYSDHAYVDRCFADLAAYWDDKMSRLQVNTPSANMNTSLNIWNLYQSEVNILFSRFASFIEVGGRTGLGYRDTAQDAMTVPHSNPEKCRQRIIELLRGETQAGYGLHLFQPEWFDPDKEEVKPFKSPTVVPEVNVKDIIGGDLKNVCSDDALWLVPSIVEYIKETGEMSLLDEMVTYADGGEGTVYEHMTRILDFSAEQVGATGICKGLRADWNDCLNLGGGESAMVSFLHYWAIQNFLEVARRLGRDGDVKKYEAMADKVRAACDAELWDGKWYVRGITASGRKIGTQQDKEGKVHMESNTWAVISGVADDEKGKSAMDSVDEYLYTPYGLMLNAPSFTVPDDEIGFVTRVYPGVKENGAVFSHPNPWAWVAEAKLGRGDRAMKFYDALLPENQNDMIEIREAEPYSYCQFIMGRDHTSHGRARHPFMTGSGGWAYFAATRYLLGIRPGFDCLTVDPCIPSDWKGFTAVRKWRGAEYRITVLNPDGRQKGVRSLTVNGHETESNCIPLQSAGSVCDVVVTM